MNLIVKKTTELTTEEILRLVDVFNIVFDAKRTQEIFLHQFLNTPMGYSIHVLMYKDDVIVGSQTYLPFYANVDGVKHKFATGGDSMIMKKYRDFEDYFDMLRHGTKYLIDDGYDALMGYPNELNYKILSKGRMAKTIGMMHTYCLPYRIGAIKKGFRYFNWLSKLSCWIWLSCSSIFASSKVSTFKISKDIESYNKCRYKRNDGIYNVQENFAYKIMNYEGIRTAFLIDVFKKSPRNYCRALSYILKHDASNFDILLYPGHLPFKITGMMKVPRRLEPKPFYMTGAVLNKKEISVDDFFRIENWDTNLSNYDLI